MSTGVKSILFLHSIAIDPTKGGIERATKTLADEFAARENAVFYIAAKRVYEDSCDRSRQFFLPNSETFDCAENAEFFERFLRENGVEIVIFQWADGKRFPFFSETEKNGVPVVAAIHTDPCFYENRLRGSGLLMRLKRALRFRRQAKIYRANARNCAATVLLSDSFAEGFLKHFPRAEAARARVLAFPNSAGFANSETRANFSAKKRELLFVGRMETRVKQPHLLLEIWKKLQARFPQWSLRMVGGGYEEAEIRALAQTLGLERVSFEGFQNPEKFYRDASIFCMTSAYEGFGMVLVEAASCGCVPVAFDSFASVRDIVSDDENGALVPAFDLDAYAETLARLMSDDSERARLAKNACTDAEKFSPAKIGDLWEKLFLEIASRARSVS